VSNSINSHTDNLADIVGLQSIIEPSITSPFIIILLTIAITIAVAYFYYHMMHGFKGQLRHIKYQLKHNHLLPRDAAHKIARLSSNNSITVAHKNTLKTLRFAAQEPSKNQIIAFINHVK